MGIFSGVVDDDLRKGGASVNTRVLSFGAVLWDIIEGKEHIGGACFNIAAHMARLGCKSSIITRLGQDTRGYLALQEIKRLSVDNSFVQMDPLHPTCIVEVELSGMGIPTFKIPENVSFDFIHIGDEELKSINEQGFDVLCFGTIEQRNGETRNSLYRLLENVKFKYIFYDVNIRLDFYPLEIVKKSLSCSSIVKLNEEEVIKLSMLLFRQKLPEDQFARAIKAEHGVDIVLITKGKDGCAVYHEDRREEFTAPVVNVVDTVGSGDAFSAMFLHNYCMTGDAFESARLGNIMGAYVASRSGAIPPYSDEIKKLVGLK